MEESEGCVFVASIILSIIGIGVTFTGALHSLFRRRNAALGLVRLGTALAMGWIIFVLAKYADPSVRGIYVVFYLVMGFAAIKLFGQLPAAVIADVRVHAGERKNMAAAIYIASWTIATGLIFGGSLWGEADPVGDDEGGWWIPVTFFLLGWFSLLIAFKIYRKREGGDLKVIIRQDRNVPYAWALASFLIVSASVLTDAVSGDFWGWRHGLLTFGSIALLLLVHEAVMRGRSRGEASAQWASSRGGETFAAIAYAIVGLGAWWMQRWLDVWLRGGG